MLRRFALPLALLTAFPTLAQEEDGVARKVDPTLYPELVKVAKITDGYRLVDRRGMTLYMLDPRDARGRTGTVVDYCVATCAELFTPIPANPSAAETGLWKPVQSKRGWLWTYRSSPVFTYRDDKKPGDTGGNGWDGLVHPIEWIPPEPKALAPAPAKPLYISGRWLLSDGKERALYTANCSAPCLAEPFRAGIATRGMGDWTVIEGSDGPQWSWRKRPVFISATAKSLPAEVGAQVIEVRAK
jgi:predicted lipoprotein with Yx(FWY)xxD motif